MQESPKKLTGPYSPYNEYRGDVPPRAPNMQGEIVLQTEERGREEWQEAIYEGLALVNKKIDEILGENNSLTDGRFTFPTVTVVSTDPEHPNWAGYFSPVTNEITLINDKIPANKSDRIKVFVHEYLHFLSHNGFDHGERITNEIPLSQNNNIGFQRYYGLDIREGSEGMLTSDYFVSFNEAVTEQLAIDIVPEGYETYEGYRGLLNQVIKDGVVAGVGSENKDCVFEPWSEQQIKNVIYVSYFKGDLAGLTSLLNGIYTKYSISEQQFGLMTRKEDLPTFVERYIVRYIPSGKPPDPDTVKQFVQFRLNKKTAADYPTDIIEPEPVLDADPSAELYGAECDKFIRENNIVFSYVLIIDGVEYEVDSKGLYIYKGDRAYKIIAYIRAQFDVLMGKFRMGVISRDEVAEATDALLFDKYKMSMLSEGFRDFYTYKHTKMDGI